MSTIELARDLRYIEELLRVADEVVRQIAARLDDQTKAKSKFFRRHLPRWDRGRRRQLILSCADPGFGADLLRGSLGARLHRGPLAPNTFSVPMEPCAEGRRTDRRGSP
jgi:hypothetical protein